MPTKVKYREGFADQFFRRYHYDADNRLTSVESSRDNVLWETDASYAFYPHGALRRTMLGADSVQGIDYTYTIQGWLKAINHPSLDVQYDPGRDGNSISGTTNKTKFGKDAFGMSLGYFPGDFLHTGSPFHSGTGALSYNLNPGNQLYDGTTNSPLYDGTITTQSSFIRPPVAGVLPDMAARQFKELVGESYRYDRSYRLRSSYFGPYQYAAPDNQGKPKWYMDGDYESHYKYDANGNFTYLRRWGRIAGPPYNVLSVNKKMDEFGDYVYTSGTNRLERFSESSYMTPFYPDDIDGEYMQSGNYVYDASGRLTTDKQEGVKPKWDVYDMVVEVVNNNGPLSSGESTPSASSKKIRYRYNAGGQRVQRLVFNFNASNGDFETEPALVQSYVYGMGGELLGIYEQKYVSGILQAEAVLKEWPLYGAGRLGLAQPAGTAAHSSTLLGATDTYSRVVDKKRYELSDHLGNVRAVVSDLKLDDGNGSFLPDEKAYYNYYPYGMLHPNRSWEAESYRFGFNGVEKENDVTVAGGIAMADFRMYDARVGRWWGVDKVVKPWESPYIAMGNNPINYADPSGLQRNSTPVYVEPGQGDNIQAPSLFDADNDDGTPHSRDGIIYAYGDRQPGVALSNEITKTETKSVPLQAPKVGTSEASTMVLAAGSALTTAEAVVLAPLLAGTGLLIGLSVNSIMESRAMIPDAPYQWVPPPTVPIAPTLPLTANATPIPAESDRTEPLAVPRTVPDTRRSFALYRTMRSFGIFPELGTTARTLGVRIGHSENDDIAPDDMGQVHPGTGGMSAAPLTPMNLNRIRRPEILYGRSRDPLWKIDSFIPILFGLNFVSDRPDHGTIQPMYTMSAEMYLARLHGTAIFWQHVSESEMLKVK